MMNYLFDRLKEPSTWRGIILVATAWGVYLEPFQEHAIISLGLALAGSSAVVSPDKLR